MARGVWDVDIAAMVEAYALTWARWLEAEAAIREQGVMVKFGRGRERPSHWVAISTRALDRMIRLQTELGLTAVFPERDQRGVRC
jgi:phage terminase small subunit